MITKYISHILNFRTILEGKYENCITREQHIENVLGETKDEKPDKNGAITLNTNLLALNEVENELFAGDKIIGVYRKDEGYMEICLYEWKKNNPRTIIAYSLLKKFKVVEQIDDIEIIRDAEKEYKK